jgi:caffeoyl-CoA O-methyltransferase
MLTGRLEGRLLRILAALLGARRILEVGTFTGYSALSMAEGLAPDGRLITLELDPDHAAAARANFAASPFADRIELLEGPALESIAGLDGPFDLVFIDADKPNYAAYYEAALRLLSPAGLIAIDNTLWSGRVLEPSDDESTQAIVALNDRLVSDPRVEVLQLPVRDGLTLIRRRA